MVGIRYENYSKRVAVIHFLLTVFPSYLSSRAQNFVQNVVILKFFARIEAICRLIALLFHFYFIRYGGVRTMAERILQLCTIYEKPPVLGFFWLLGQKFNLFYNSSSFFIIFFIMGPISEFLIVNKYLVGVRKLKFEFAPFIEF